MNRLQRTGKAAGFLAAAIGARLFGPKPPKRPQQVQDLAAFEAYVSSLVAMSRPPGLSVVVVKDGRIAYSKSFGLADGPRNIPATPETVYQWMSMTKMVTATAIFQLREQGKLDLDDPVSKHLPDFAVESPKGESRQVSIRQLLNHSSGLANPAGMVSMIHFDGDPWPSQVNLAAELVATHKRLKFEPGTQATYTNLGYTVLGAVVEAVSGQPHREYVRDHIFRPLGMNRTDYVYSDAMLADAAVGSQPTAHLLSAMMPMLMDDMDSAIRETVGGRMWLKRVYPDFTGAGGVVGPATETARFVTAFLNDGECNGARILAPESVNIMLHDGQVRAKGGPAQFYRGVRHGLGWWVWPDGDRRRIMHSGDGPGFSNIMQLYPDEKLGIIVQGNEWAYGVAFSGVALRDGIAQLAAGLDWSRMG